MASFGGYLDILALLLDCGADINHQDNEGMDALHWAIRRHHPEAVKLLLEKGAYPNNIGFVQVRQIMLPYWLCSGKTNYATLLALFR
jgi:inversin